MSPRERGARCGMEKGIPHRFSLRTSPRCHCRRHQRLPRHPCTGGQTYLLMFLSEKWAFTAVRCSDEEVSFGQLAGQTPRDRLVW